MVPSGTLCGKDVTLPLAAAQGASSHTTARIMSELCGSERLASRGQEDPATGRPPTVSLASGGAAAPDTGYGEGSVLAAYRGGPWVPPAGQLPDLRLVPSWVAESDR